DRREILRQHEVTDLQLIVKRTRKAGANQIIELLILQEFSHLLPAHFCSNASMYDFNRVIIDLSANYPDIIAINLGIVAQTAQEFRAFGRQSKRNRNHPTT